MSEPLKISILDNTDSQEFEISNDKMQMLNSFIDENLRNRRNGTNYDLLYRVSGMMTNEININDRHTNPITKPSTEEQTKDIALQFFKSLDQELYENVKNILEGKSDFAFNMYQLKEDEDFSKTKDDGMPIHTKIPCVMSRDGKLAIYVPCKGTIEDIYLLVHELAHTFDFIENDNPTRNLMGEITPHCFEAMLSQYLLENGIATREDVVNREKASSISHYDDGVETFAKLELMHIKEQQREIKQEDIVQMQKKYGITNGQLGFVLGRLAQSEPNVDYRARYMIAQLVYPHYIEKYKQNPQKAIHTIKDYFEQIKSNNMMGSLETLGIEPSIDCISGLIKECNDRLQSLEQTRLFSEEEIGKRTINIPTIKKDESKKKEKFMNEIDKLKNEIKEKGEFTDEMFEKAVEKYLSKFLNGEEPDGAVFTKGFDVGDLKGIKISLSNQNLKRLTFVKEAFSEEQRRELGIEEIIEKGKFSNKMKYIHDINSNNTAASIGIIDSYFKVDGLQEFEGRDVTKVIIYCDKEKGIIINPSVEFSEEDFHGKTTACLAAGNECGVIPESQLYLFQLNGVNREEAYEHILKYMKEHNIKLDALIDPSFNQEAKVIQNSLNELDGDKKCEYFNTADFWKNCAWGRYSDDGKEIELDEIAEKIINKIVSGKIDGNGMEEKLKVMGNIDDKVLIPCTGMTGIQEDFKDKDKYYGSVCGASFPTTVLGSIFASVRQINPNITKEHFFEVMKDTALTNSRGQKYLNEEGMLKQIEEEIKMENEKIKFFHDQKSDKDKSTGVYTVPPQEKNTKELGKETFNEQKDTKEKMEVEQKIAQEIRKLESEQEITGKGN